MTCSTVVTSTVLPGKIQCRTGSPSRVTARPTTICAASLRPFFECPRFLGARYANGQERYRNAFVTNHPITAENVAELIEAGRARWKVENENNNTLKTQGYHLTHNSGHGKRHLATTLVSLNLLAFLIHTVLDLDHRKYRAIRGALSSRAMFFQHVQALTCYLYFESFEALLDFMMRGLELSDFDTS